METKSKSGESAAAEVGIGPYKATKLWNDVIAAFRQGVPRGKHRRYIRTAEDCFVGSAAVDWLMEYLKKEANIGRNVTRQQTTQLLNKFYKAGIFEEIQVSRRGRNKTDFSDSNRLYRLLPTSPTKGIRTPLASRSLASSNIPATVPLSLPQPDGAIKLIKRTKHKSGDRSQSARENEAVAERASTDDKKHRLKSSSSSGKLALESLPQCHLVGRILTFSEVSEIWKTAALSRLKKILSQNNLDDILQGYTVNGGNVRHNCIFLNKSGIVTNIPSEDHLPHWVLSAMKCLARWPEKAEGDLPSYPGFERDVFSVVRDYFLGLPQPLISHSLYDVVTNVYVQACNQLPRHSSPYAHGGRSRSHLGQSLWSAASVENIILNLTRKYCMTDSSADLRGLTDSQPNLFYKASSRSDRLQSADSHTDLKRMTYSHSNLHGMTFPESDCFFSSKSHSDLPGMGPLHYGESHPDIFGMTESCVDLHGQRCVHAVPERLGVSSVSAYPARTSRSSTSGPSAGEVRKRFHSTPDLQVAHYETAFGPENQTVTRVYYSNGVATDFKHETCPESNFYSPVETHFDVAADVSKPGHSAGNISFDHSGSRSGNLTGSYNHSRSVTEHSQSLHKSTSDVPKGTSEVDLCRLCESGAPSHSGASRQSKSLSPAWSTLPRSPPQRRTRAERYNTVGGADFDFVPKGKTENRGLEEAGRQFSSSTPYLPGVPDEDGPSLWPKTRNGYSCSTAASGKRNASLFMNFPQSALCEERATKALQVVFLFLAPASRRKLQFLLRLLSKMTANPSLSLDPTQSTRSLVLSTFQRAVLQSPEGDELDEVLVLQLMSFLMDHHMDILAVPTDMKEAVEDRLRVLEKPQIVYTQGDTETLRFCQPMSVQQYEATTQDHSQKALADLLDNIVSDQNMPDKDKRRRLRQFQKTHPDIYKKRFPTSESDPLQRETRPTLKPPLLAKPLLKLRGLRV